MSILVNYYRLSPAERVKVMHDQKTWDEFYHHVEISRSKALREAIEKVNVDGLSPEQRYAKIGAAIKSVHDPKQFNMEKDWHVIAYLLTGETKIKEEHLPDKPLHNVIFGGLKSAVTT